MGSSSLFSLPFLDYPLTSAPHTGLGKTMQTISLICTDDTGEGVLDEPEEPDERFDDMTLIGSFSFPFFPSQPTLTAPLRSLPALRRVQLDRSVPAARRQEASQVALLPRRGSRAEQEATQGVRRRHRYLVRCLSPSLPRPVLTRSTCSQTLAGGIEDERKGKKGSSKISDPNAEEEELSDSPFSNAGLSKKAKKTPADKKDSTLHAVKWRRVVLDEGHLIKNPKAKMSRACADLKAERRWILTGTPIINAAGDRASPSLLLLFFPTCTDERRRS